MQHASVLIDLASDGSLDWSSFFYIARTRTDQLTPAVLSCFVVLFVVCSCALCFVLFSLSAFLFLHGDSTMDYVSIQSVLFLIAHVDRTEGAI